MVITAGSPTGGENHFQRVHVNNLQFKPFSPMV